MYKSIALNKALRIATSEVDKSTNWKEVFFVNSKFLLNKEYFSLHARRNKH